jgi:uncharacterized protein
MGAIEIQASIEAKEHRLREQLAQLPSVIVALSGGTDSAYLAWVAHQVLVANGSRPFDSPSWLAQGDSSPSARNQRGVLAVTALSASFPESERRGVEEFVRRHGLAHEFIRTDELSNPLYVANQPDRCYHCKDELFAKLEALARARSYAAVAYGLNLDDLADFRPGQRAAREHGVLTPLVDAGLTKADIRELSRRAGLETWDKPAAACLASRIAYGIAVTEENLSQVERAEAALRALGFRQLRVRYHNELARVEVAVEELPRALEPAMAARIRDALKAIGFRYVTLDLEGYRQGSFNPKT